MIPSPTLPGPTPRALGSAAVAFLAAGFALGFALVPSDAVAAERADDPPASTGSNEDVTFARDIAPILQENCQACHQPGSIAPMTFMTYEEVRPWAPMIRDRVEQRLMPPWAMNPHVGIQEFKNDKSLTEKEIETIVRWVEAGAPLGDPADMPPPVEWPAGGTFQTAQLYGEPDLILYTDPYTVPASGGDQWWRPLVETGLTQDRWVKAIEVLPAFPDGLPVTHHLLARIEQEAGMQGLLTEWAVGSDAEIFPEGAGKLMQAGSKIDFEVHYYPSGEEVVADQVGLGIWFFPEGYEPEYPTVLRMFNVAPQNTLYIAPHSTATFINDFVLDQPTRIESFQPHMHLRGKGMSMEAIYPDGRREMLSLVDDFQFNWHTNYMYSDHAAPLLPAGSTLRFTVWYDNTVNHGPNPHPGNFVSWGDRAADEMGHAWVSLTTLQQHDFERLVAEREAMQQFLRADEGD